MAEKDASPSITSSCGTNSEGTQQDAKSGGWDYVYIKTSQDGKGTLVELHDSQERCSNVSTVLGHLGFVAPITLAVPCRMLPPGAVPVIAGNTIELGEWDAYTAETMSAAATQDLQAPGFAFFSATICSNYSTEEETLFRFAILVTPSDGPGGLGGAEIHCWEGKFVRRVADYTGQGVAFLVFGRPEPMADTAQLLAAGAALPQAPPLLSPGWLADPGQAMILLRLEPPQLDLTDKQHRGLAALPVELRLSWVPPDAGRLTPNFRGPLALGKTVDPVADQSETLRFQSAGEIRAEFLQQLTLDAAVSPVLHFRFGDSLEATALLPQQLLAPSLPPMPPEEEILTSDLRLLCAPSAGGQRRRGCIGQVSVRLRRLRHCCRCAPESLLSLDRCGPIVGPPFGPLPIRIEPLMPDYEEVVNFSASTESPASAWKYFELPIGVSANGRVICFGSGGAEGTTAALNAQPDSASHGLAVRIVRHPDDPPEALEAAADAVLSLLMPAERWALLVAQDLQLCALLCLKQMRLPVAMAFAGEGDSTAEALDTCRHYGVRAVVAPAALLSSGDLLTAARSRGLAVYAYGASTSPEVSASLEGIFAEGTFAECRFESADDSMILSPSPAEAEKIPAAKRSFCSRLF